MFLADRREANGLTQKELAYLAGTSQSAVSRIEHNRCSPTMRTLQHFLKVMGEDLVLTWRPER